MYPILKRLLDVTIAGVVLLLLAPVLLPIMIALRFTGEGEVFYSQPRVGFKRESFGILKLATMLKDSPNMAGGEITLRNDPRMTPLGPFLRKSKLNEIPQLLNVLKGEMSVVGPRPLMKVSFDLYSPAVQNIVYESKPGLTGIASLVFRDEERFIWESGADPREFYRDVIYPYKGELESWYYQHRSFGTDFKILVLTAAALFFPKSDLTFSWFDGLPPRPKALTRN